MKALILMSTYNGEKYIRKQIESILNQDERDCSIVVRDDGSNDSTCNIIREYIRAFPNRILLIKGENMGVAKSFFELVRIAPKADYYFFSDQDDVWMRDKVSSAIKHLEENSGKPALYCSAVRIVNQDLKVIRNKYDAKKEYTFGNSLLESITQGCTFAFNESLRTLFLLFDPNDLDIHDWMMYRTLMAVSGFIYYDREPHILYRQHGGNVVGANNRLLTWKTRFKKLKSGKMNTVRSKEASAVLRTLYNEMPSQNIKTCEVLSSYNQSLRNKMRAVFNHELVMDRLIDTIILKVAFILGAV